MAAKRKVGNLLAVAVLSVIIERPMHRYEIASTLRDRGKDRDMAIKWGSLYTVVQNMAKAGFLEIVGSEREGARPERVIYQITDAGRAELIDWTRELIAEPQPEQGQYVAGLSILAALSPDEVIELLGHRLAALDEQIATVRAEFDATSGSLPRLFMVETEYGLAMLDAERAWTRSFRDELAAGEFPGQDAWRNWHIDGMNQDNVDDLMEGGNQHP
ncbi:PadR family transcriptional regulator [Nocardia sp. NPDC059180]|uniref:PadR family transcriptional regulator n=1 Tax=Nocardia sp. NPDC059180 TaxID=3346761 RepID=UPI00367FE3FC